MSSPYSPLSKSPSKSSSANPWPVELAIQVLEGKSVPSLSSAESGSDSLIVTASLVGGVRETLPASLTIGISGRVVWNKGNVLSWRLENSQLNELKKIAPTIRLTIMSRERGASPGSTGTYVGYALLPLRAAEMSLSANHGPWDGWLPLAGPNNKGGSIRVIAGMLRIKNDDDHDHRIMGDEDTAIAAANADYTANSALGVALARLGAMSAKRKAIAVAEAEAATAAAATAGGVGEDNQTLMKTQTTAISAAASAPPPPDASAAFLALHSSDSWGNMSAAAAASTSRNPASISRSLPHALPAMLDAIPVGLAGGRKYWLRIALRGARGLGNLFLSESKKTTTSRVWLSYKLFGVLVQSDAATSLNAAALVKPTVDAFALRGSLSHLALFLAALPPLEVHVCVPGRVLAVARVDLSRLVDALPTAVRPIRLAEGLVPGGEADAGIEETFAGAELEGGFELSHMSGLDVTQGVRAFIDAVVTLEPADDASAQGGDEQQSMAVEVGGGRISAQPTPADVAALISAGNLAGAVAESLRGSVAKNIPGGGGA